MNFRIGEIYEQNPGIGREKLAELAGCSEWTARLFIDKKRQEDKRHGSNRQITKEDEGNTLSVTAKSLDIRTLDDLLDNSDVNLELWQVERHVINSWEVTAGDGQCYTNYQVKAWFKPKSADWGGSLRDVAASLKPRRSITCHQNKAGMLFVPTVFDHHFGKLAWGEETGDDYDLKIAEDLWHKAIASDIATAKRFGGVERILFPLGSDLLHINGQDNSTAKGTPQSVDSRLPKIFRTAARAVIASVEQMAHIAPIDIEPVYGNHDPTQLFSLMEYISAWFRDCKHVNVNTTLRKRVPYSWGDNFIGLAHGDGMPMDRLPLIFSTEYPLEWGAAKRRTILAGHVHKQKEVRYTSSDTHGNATVHICPSLSGTDDWHYEHGYIGDKITESHIFSKRGKVATFETTASELQDEK